jgi:hypothetical protein
MLVNCHVYQTFLQNVNIQSFYFNYKVSDDLVRPQFNQPALQKEFEERKEDGISLGTG